MKTISPDDDDHMSTEVILQHWAKLTKVLEPDLYEYIIKAKEEYANRGWLDRADDKPDPSWDFSEAEA